ncbi:MAG TPA: hypothetical protein VHD37_02370 [Candidatus Paceibacterota bacterium]|nr:hypothetical protein [Candidatus Paceibacterota bacterium]
MQNPAVMWGIGAVVVVAGGLGIWLYGGAGTGTGSASLSGAVEQGQTAAESEKPQTLKSLIAYQGTQKCTFENATANSSSSGTVYVANGQMRGDFTSVAQGKTFDSHMIVKGNTSYVWGSSMPGGFKMSFDSMAAPSGSSGGSVDPNAPVNYSCGAWSADESMFELPASVQFQDLTNFTVPAMPGH